ncbi:MAG: fibrobacter succinogenes major paralogous domain-containing protein [Bacteroidales bacterium]|nr:fibrobacter succinogenes major paralogous domain-containing protein [Bacteroidales bacterium]
MWGLSLTILLWVCAMHAHAQNVYVSASATDDGGAGTSWETAKQTIAAGIAAVGGGGTVFVKAGGYSTDAELVIPSGVTVMGGYDPASTGTDTSQRRLPGANLHWADNAWCTIITGAGNHRIATVQGELDGCVLRNGYTSTLGGGVLIDGGNAVVRYCVIKECDAYNEDPYGTPAEGGGAYVQNGGTLLNCVVTECRGDKGAGVAGGNGSLISNTITRNRPTDCGVVADYDGNLYKTVVLGDQCWMRENLRTTRYADGTLIEEGTSYSTTTPYRYRGYVSETMHISDPSIFARCGYLYNWVAVMHGAASSNTNPSGVQGICPTGWHVPSMAEWDQMANFVMSVPKYRCNGNNSYNAKSLSNKTGWVDYSGTCCAAWQTFSNNATLFSACPVGYYDGNYYGFTYYADFWTSTQTYSSAYFRYIDYNYPDMRSSNWGVGYGSSVRCVKDN